MDGGFASQLNQWLFGKYILKETGRPVKFDMSFFENNGMDLNGKYTRAYDLEKVFEGIIVPKASQDEINLFRKKYRFKSSKDHSKFCNKIKDARPPKYFGSYYYHWKYLSEVLDEIDKLKFTSSVLEACKITADEISRESCPIACHIRRGDYVGSVFDVLTPEYFIESIKLLYEKHKNETPVFYMFSNDMDYVRSEIIPKLPQDICIKCVEGNDNDAGFNDFYLITRCKHYISSNSGFKLAAFFIEDFRHRDIVIPEVWMKGLSGDAHHFPSFTVMRNDGGGLAKE